MPVLALQNCVLPVLSFNYVAGNWGRCSTAVRTALAMGGSLLCVRFELVLDEGKECAKGDVKDVPNAE